MKYSILEKKFLGLLVIVFLVVSGLVYFTFNIAFNALPFWWLSIQPKVNAQSVDKHFGDGFSDRQSVTGTVARGYLPYAFSGQDVNTITGLINPLAVTDNVLKKGQSRFLTYCSACHGNLGDGASRLKGQFATPPSFHLDKYRRWTDGQFYHIITEGKVVNDKVLMPSHRNQILSRDRWAIVHYIRVLQRAMNAKDTDLN